MKIIRSRNVFHKLFAREIAGGIKKAHFKTNFRFRSVQKFYESIPKKNLIYIYSVSENYWKEARPSYIPRFQKMVLLGFSRCGSYLIGYAFENQNLKLDFWFFSINRPPLLAFEMLPLEGFRPDQLKSLANSFRLKLGCRFSKNHLSVPSLYSSSSQNFFIHFIQSLDSDFCCWSPPPPPSLPLELDILNAKCNLPPRRRVPEMQWL